MNLEAMKEIASSGLDFVERFFNELNGDDKLVLPAVLKSGGRWMANYDGFSTIGFFCLSQAELKRAVKYQNKGWPAFPGLLVSEAQKPPKAPVAIRAGGSCSYFASNHTTNLFAFCVPPNSSFTLIDHFHEIKDSTSGQEFSYRVELGFVLGIAQDEGWPEAELRLAELLNHTMEVWRKLQ